MHRHVTSRNQGTFSRQREDPGNEVDAFINFMFSLCGIHFFLARYCHLRVLKTAKDRGSRLNGRR